MDTRTTKLLTFEKVYDFYHELGLQPKSLFKESDFSIYNFGGFGIQPPYQSPIYRSNFFSFVFVKDATGKCSSDGCEFELCPHMVYFNNPGHIKQFGITGLQDLYYLTLSEVFLKENVHPQVFDEFSFLLSEKINPKVLSATEFSEFEDLYLQIQKAYHSCSPYRNRLIGHLFVAVLIKVKEYFWQGYDPVREGNRASEIVNQFKKLMDQHYRELSCGLLERANRVQDYADQLCLHPNYLNNVIKSKTGKSVGSWIAEKTINEAKVLLRNSNIPLKEISYRLGFMEPQNFSTYFKKHTQRTPLIYRQSV